jgi:hypothetical protein
MIIRIGQQSFEQRGVHLAARARSPSRSNGGATASITMLPGTGVERDHVFRLCVCRNHGDVRNAADIQRDARRSGCRKS